MKIKNFFYLISLLLAFSFLVSCKDDKNLIPDQQQAEYKLTVTPTIIDCFESTGGEKTIHVTTEKIIKSFFNQVHDPKRDVSVTPDFTVEIDNDDFEYIINGNEVTVFALEYDGISARTADLTIALKRKPEINVVIKLRQSAPKQFGEAFSSYFLQVTPSELVQFPVLGGSQQVEIVATKKSFEYVSDEYLVRNVVETPYTAVMKGTGFSHSVSGNILTITADQNTGNIRRGSLTITLDEDPEKTITIPLEQAPKGFAPFPENHVFARLAEFNISTVPGVFVTSHDNDKQGLYTWANALDACPDGYRLPTKEEINVYMPDHAAYVGYGATGVAYRILGNAGVLTAYRYERVGNFVEGNLTSRLKITGRFLGYTEITQDKLTDENWWQTDNANDITHYFPANGRLNATGTLEHRGFRGHYWSSQENTNTIAWFMSIYTTDAYVNTHMKTISGSVRCIKN